MSRFSKHKWWLMTVVLTAPLFVLAGPVPNTFTAGTPISSQQVNDNFKNLSDRLDVHAAPRIGYATAIPSKWTPRVSNGLDPEFGPHSVTITGTTTDGYPTGPEVYGSVHLPHGVRVTAVRCFARDNDAGSDFSGGYVRIAQQPVTNPTGGSYIFQAPFSTTGANVTAAYVDLTSTATAHLIDNENYIYGIEFNFTITAPPTGFQLQFYGCRLTYETPALE